LGQNDRVRQLAGHRATARLLDLTGSVGAVVAVLDIAPSPAVPRRGTVLLVPGYTGTKEDFAPLLDPLADRGHRVVTMDQPGQYESVGPDDAAAYSVQWLGAVVRAVAAALLAEDHAREDGRAGGTAHLLGHSFGGLVAREAVIGAPELFRSLVLLGSGPAAIGGSRKDRMTYIEPLLENGGMPAVYEAAEQLARLDPSWQAAPAELQAFLKTRFLASSGHGLKGMGDALLTEPDRVEELRAVGLPMLVCHGEHDDAWLPVTQAAMAQRLGARHEVIPGAVHSPAVEAPEPTVTALAGFWADVEKPR
jgi:pimeloyl-ACP methyl ester carboxylesterase